MTISRTRVILTNMAAWILLALLLLCLVLYRGSAWTYLLAILTLGDLCGLVSNTRCPHCRRFGLKPRPFAKNAGYCNYCGKLIGYDEQK